MDLHPAHQLARIEHASRLRRAEELARHRDMLPRAVRERRLRRRIGRSLALLGARIAGEPVGTPLPTPAGSN